ncbi:MAG: hypothetical protein ACXWCV_07405 [Caldimonas sp.]
MSLLQALDLPRLAHLFPATGAPGPGPGTTVASGASAPQAAKPAAAHGGNGADASDVRAEAKKVRGAIAAREKEAKEALARLIKLAPLLDQKIEAATGEAKKKLLEQKGQFDKRTTETMKAINEAKADLEAIDNPASGREELVKIMARHGSTAKVSEEIEVTNGPGLDPYKKRIVNRESTTTTTSLEKGQATIETDHDKQHVGLGGVTKEHSSEKVVQTKDSTARTSEEKKSHVSWTGKASFEEKKVSEVELADGRRSSAEHSTAKELSAKGASKTQTDKVTNLDGSSNSKTKTHGAERGEGQVTATTGTTVTQTSKSGTAHTTDKKASGGFDAKDGAMGAHGGLDGSKTVTSKKGMQAGIVAGVHANVMCKIGEPTGNPKKYLVTLTVSFGASLAVSGGVGKKEGSKGSASVELKGSDDKSMTVTHTLTEEQLGTYVQSLQAASKGSKVAATENEFAIIAAGVKQGWGAARELYKTGAITKKATDALVNPGDGIKVTDTKTGGFAAKGEGKGIGVGYGVTDSHAKMLEVKRNEKGGLDADTETEDGRTKSKSGSMAVLGMGVSVGKTITHKTSFGYSITIDPKNDPDGKILEALGKCESQMQYAVFMGVYKGKITVTGKTEGTSDAESLDTGVSVAGVTVFSMGEGHGVDAKTKTDAKGKVVSKTVSAHANIGGKLGGWADSKNDDAVAEIDGEGHGKVKLTTTENDNHNSRSRDKSKKKAMEKLAGQGKQTGALTDLAGGEEEDSATHDVSGLTLSNADLKKIGAVAYHSLDAWVGLRRRADEKEDLKKAGIEIAKAKGAPGVVAEQLTRFIGGDSVERLETVRRIARGGYHSTMGNAFEFPDSIRGLQEDYETVIDDGLVKKINAIGSKSQAKAKEECQRLLKICDSLMSDIGACKDFKNTATRAEMVQKLELVRQNLAVSVKGFGGEKPVADMKQLAEDGKRLAKQCSAFYVDQQKLFADLHELKGDDKMIPTGDRGDARKLIKKLEDLIYRWRGQWYLLKDNYKAQGLPEAMLMIPTILPDEKVVDFWDQACGN